MAQAADADRLDAADPWMFGGVLDLLLVLSPLLATAIVLVIVLLVINQPED